MSQKKVLQKPSLTYTSNPDYRKPPKTANPVSNLFHCLYGVYSSFYCSKTSVNSEYSLLQRFKVG